MPSGSDREGREEGSRDARTTETGEAAQGRGSRRRRASPREEEVRGARRWGVLKRTNSRRRLRRRDRSVIAALARRVPRDRWSGFRRFPATILRWHRERVCRKWTYQRPKPGRLPLDHHARSHDRAEGERQPAMRRDKDRGELQGSGTESGPPRSGRSWSRRRPAAPGRGGPSWSKFLRTQAETILACDFFTLETSFLT